MNHGTSVQGLLVYKLSSPCLARTSSADLRDGLFFFIWTMHMSLLMMRLPLDPVLRCSVGDQSAFILLTGMEKMPMVTVSRNMSPAK